MNILINASVIKKGGGIQVVDSICRELYKYKGHSFYIVLSSVFINTYHDLLLMERNKSHLKVYRYTLRKSMRVLLTGRDRFLDTIVIKENIDAVLTIFGPSFWVPKCVHVSGFALAHCVVKDSPFFSSISFFRRVPIELNVFVKKFYFNRCSSIYYTENPVISELFNHLFPRKKVWTVSNYYNQIFDYKELWDTSINLGNYDGCFTILTVSAYYPHKNLEIIIPTINYLVKHYHNFKFRFILTIDEQEFPKLSEVESAHILFVGKVNINQCPHLYEQSDVMMLPTLLECFSASYVEAMKMDCPIITTDLSFARGLCGDAALYFAPLSAESLGEAIFNLASNKNLYIKLVTNGKAQLRKFDNYSVRVEKLLRILEDIINVSKKTI